MFGSWWGEEKLCPEGWLEAVSPIELLESSLLEPLEFPLPLVDDQLRGLAEVTDGRMALFMARASYCPPALLMLAAITPPPRTFPRPLPVVLEESYLVSVALDVRSLERYPDRSRCDNLRQVLARLASACRFGDGRCDIAVDVRITSFLQFGDNVTVLALGPHLDTEVVVWWESNRLSGCGHYFSFVVVEQGVQYLNYYTRKCEKVNGMCGVLYG